MDGLVPGQDYRYEPVYNVHDFYIDDIEAIFALVSHVCDAVEMQSREFENITLENISDIRLERLVGFRILGLNPKTIVAISTFGSTVDVIVEGGGHRGGQLFDHLVAMLNRRKRRFFGIPTDRLFLPGAVLLAIAGAVLVAVEMTVTTMPGFVARLLILPVGILLIVLLHYLFRYDHKPTVVYPFWRRDSSPASRINWREQSVSFLQSLMILVIGFILGKYF